MTPSGIAASLCTLVVQGQEVLMRKLSRLFSVALAIGVFAAAPAAAQRVVVNGDMWLKSSPELRKAFLVGAGNAIALERAYATKKGIPVPPAGDAASKAISAMTLDQISDRITRWYEANPQRRNVPVMGVVWIDMVKPTLPPK
jgi:hypothetical protein